MKAVIYLCLLMILCCSCDKDSFDDTPGNENTYPIDIPITNYQLPKQCAWNYSISKDSIFPVRSETELLNYSFCYDRTSSGIDFSENSLLIASGIVKNRILSVSSNKLQRISDNKYVLTVDILMDELDKVNAEQWNVLLTVPKLQENASLRLEVNKSYRNDEDEYERGTPIDVKDYSPSGSSCFWNNLSTDAKFFNSKEQLYQAMPCLSNEDIPEIDFSKNTLLTITSNINHWNEIIHVDKGLRKISDTEYILKMNIEAYRSLVSIGNKNKYDISIIVPKLPANASLRRVLVNKIEKENPILSQPNTPVDFTDYSIPKESCYWNKVGLYKVNLVNSKEQLFQLTSCPDEIVPEIDFSKRTLIVAHGETPDVIGKFSKKLLKISEKEYLLFVEVKLGMAPAIDRWTTVISVDKLPDDAVVKLYVMGPEWYF